MRNLNASMLDALSLYVSADTEPQFECVKYAVADHLERFAQKDSIKVIWTAIPNELV